VQTLTLRQLAAVSAIVVWSTGAAAQEPSAAPPPVPIHADDGTPQDKGKPSSGQKPQQKDKKKVTPGKGEADPAQPPKPPPVPLFPRHRRGLYRNAQGIEVIDATPQSPPLDTDDPGVPDKGEFEINLSTHADIGQDKKEYDLLRVDANYGVLPVIFGYKLPTQIKLEFPVAGAREAGESFKAGLGTTAMGLKFNFYDDDRRGISVSVYPQIEFPTPGGRGVAKGLAEDGQTLVLPLLVEREFHDFTFVLNAALEKPLHDPERDTTTEFGVGFGRAFTRKVAGMIELRSEQSLSFTHDRLVYVNGGFIHGVRNIITYVNVGHSLFADDGLGHTYLGFGIKVLLDTDKDDK
jgi:hypothetical protein